MFFCKSPLSPLAWGEGRRWQARLGGEEVEEFEGTLGCLAQAGALDAGAHQGEGQFLCHVGGRGVGGGEAGDGPTQRDEFEDVVSSHD